MNQIKIVYICGTNHSGSTMLYLMLSNGYKNVHSCGELYRIGKYCMNMENDWERAEQQIPFQCPSWTSQPVDLAR